MNSQMLIIDSFAGGGGASLGIERALGRPVDVAINHNPAAIAMHKANHPRTKHYRKDIWKLDPRAVVGHAIEEPLGTQTTKDHTGLILVTIGGEDYVIVDIGMRMLTPRELARGQGFPDSYLLTGNKTEQIGRIGNSVCPPVAAALVRANCGGWLY